MATDPFIRYARSGIKPGLRRIRRLLRGMDNPQRRFRSIIVAGSNGKGTTAALLQSMFGAAGIRAGLFTSPHLVSVRERFRIGSTLCSMRALNAFEREHGELCRNTGATYFEVTTACALWLFARARVRWAILEIGLGGRWDACNVVNPDLSIITSISKEHTEFLGTTLGEIAREKAQVARPYKPVLVGRLPYSAERSMRSELRRIGALAYWLGADFDVKNVVLSHRGTRATLMSASGSLNVSTSLLGEYPAVNTGLAARAFQILSAEGSLEPKVKTSAAIRQGARNVNWPARIQVVDRRPLTVFDVSHNAAAIQALAEDWRRIWPNHKPWVVLGLLQDKGSPGVARAIAGIARAVVLTRPESPRAMDPERLREAFNDHLRRVLVEQDPGEAFRKARDAAGARGAVLVCGSHYLTGPLLEYRGYWP